MNDSPPPFCPVPPEQQPLQEYEQLQNAWLFNWTLQPVGVYTRKLIWVWIWGWVVAGPIAAASFPPQKYPWQWGLMGTGGSLVFVVLLLIRLYLGWHYVGDRLQQEQVSYEESGWYDGQTWVKPPQVLTRDRLIFTYQIQPILDRLHKTFATIALLISLGSITWLISSHYSPS